MGLDTSHGCFTGAYSSFKKWRHLVAKAAGFMIEDVRFKGELETRSKIMCEWHLLDDEKSAGIWDENPQNILYVLFFHSDFAGEIRPAQGLPLADALEALLPKIAELDIGSARDGGSYFVRTTEEFIAGLREAGVAGEPVEFY